MSLSAHVNVHQNKTENVSHESYHNLELLSLGPSVSLYDLKESLVTSVTCLITFSKIIKKNAAVVA